MKVSKIRSALVTGASFGIGRAISTRFAAEGLNVAINCPDAKTAQQYGRETKNLMMQARRDKEQDRKTLIVTADVSEEDAVIDMYSIVLKELGGIDILVNNAGIQMYSDSDIVNMRDFDRVMNVNLRGAYLCARAAIQYFLNNDIKGVIINISSVHEIIPKPKYISYSISKGGIGNLTRTLAAEYADRGIRVNGVAPGVVLTPMNKDYIDDPTKRRLVEEHIPLGRVCNTNEIASAVWFLASDEASYITGQTLYVDGGLTLYPEFIKPWLSGH